MSSVSSSTGISAAKAKREERLAHKKLSKKEKYLKTSAKVLASSSSSKVSSSNASSTSGEKTTSKKPKLSALDEAYANAGNIGNDLFSAGRKLFKILFDMDAEAFIADNGGETINVVERQNPNFYEEWLNKEDLFKTIEENDDTLKDINLWRIVTGDVESRPCDRETFKSLLNAGCTLRMVEPQSYFPKLWRMISLLEAFWGQPASAMIQYKNTEKTTPVYPLHSDCRDVFAIVLEGSCEWNVWEPSDEEDVFQKLPLDKSPILQPEEVESLNECISSRTLQAGDYIYVPRGYVAEGKASGECLLLLVFRHSAEMTWGDLVEQVLLKALAAARQSNEQLRRPLPRDFARVLGAQHAGSALEEDEGELGQKRATYQLQALKLIKSSVMKNLNVDSGADDVLARFLDVRVKPALEADPDDEEPEDVEDPGCDPSKLTLSSEVELCARDCARICVEDGLAVVRHSMKNSHRRQGNDERRIEFDLDDAPTIEGALTEVDGPFTIGSLPEVLLEEGEEPEEFGGRIRVAKILIQEGILRLVKY